MKANKLHSLKIALVAAVLLSSFNLLKAQGPSEYNYWLKNSGGLQTLGVGSTNPTLSAAGWNHSIQFALNVNAIDIIDWRIKRPNDSQKAESTALFYSPRAVARVVSQGRLEFAGGGKGNATAGTNADMVISNIGNVGIGTMSPNRRLHVNGFVQFDLASNDNRLVFGEKNNGNDRTAYIFTERSSSAPSGSRNHLGLSTFSNQGALTLYDTGALTSNFILISKSNNPNSLPPLTGTNGISQANREKYALFVENGILSEDYAIGARNTWADFVFDQEYQLPDLKEVESYINENKRLPEIPSAAEVQEEGYNLHDMNVKLLQKVEELTLYTIQQNKKIEKLESAIESLQTPK